MAGSLRPCLLGGRPNTWFPRTPRSSVGCLRHRHPIGLLRNNRTWELPAHDHVRRRHGDLAKRSRLTDADLPVPRICWVNRSRGQLTLTPRQPSRPRCPRSAPFQVETTQSTQVARSCGVIASPANIVLRRGRRSGLHHLPMGKNHLPANHDRYSFDLCVLCNFLLSRTPDHAFPTQLVVECFDPCIIGRCEHRC